MAQNLVRVLWAASVVASLLVAVAPGSVRADSEPSARTIGAFVDALYEVDAVVEAWTPRLESASSEQEVKTLQEQANAEAVAAIEGLGGITVEEYLDIAEAAKTDPALADRINAEIESRAKP